MKQSLKKFPIPSEGFYKEHPWRIYKVSEGIHGKLLAQIIGSIYEEILMGIFERKTAETSLGRIRRFFERILWIFYQWFPGEISKDIHSVVLEEIHRFFFKEIYGEISERNSGRFSKWNIGNFLWISERFSLVIP